jgi:hypothetical protein
LVAIEVVRKFGKDNVVLLNHNISPRTEGPDIKRFKKEVSEYLGIEITYANYGGIMIEDEIPDQFDVLNGAFTNQKHQALCTHELKTKPFMAWLSEQGFNGLFGDSCIIYYGFDKSEGDRISRRIGILSALGYKTDYPLAFWDERTIVSTLDIGIERPNTYDTFKHANCVGCLKAGILHWYVTFSIRRDIFEKAKNKEMDLGFAINTVTTNKETNPLFLYELEPFFHNMQSDGIPATEHQSSKKFVAMLKSKYGLVDQSKGIPCECISN